MNKIEIKHVEEIAYRLAIDTMGSWEPIPPFKTRFPHKLEASLNAPFQTYAKKYLYPTLTDRAAILFYLMIKNHPFQNGNKRLAVTTLLTFLAFGKKWLSIGVNDLYNLAVRVAQSLPKDKDKILQYIKATVALGLSDF